MVKAPQNWFNSSNCWNQTGVEVFKFSFALYFSINYTQHPSKHSSWWRRLEDVFRLDQDEYVRLSLTSSEGVFKASWSRPIYSSWLYVFKRYSRRFQDFFKTSCQDVFKTFSRRLQDILQKRLQDIFKTSSRRFENVFKTCSRRFQDVLSKCSW